ncbi:MAG: S-layer protein, partial [Planctomyces sp.]
MSKKRCVAFRFSLIFATLASAVATVTSATSATAEQPPVSFVNDVMPMLTRHGCNAGVCHAKAGNGQNGFQLSLLGFEPAEDYEHLVKEARGRRLFPAVPENSLLLLKATGAVPHGGGRRIAEDSEAAKILVQWIRQGALWDGSTAPAMVRLAVTPAKGTVQRHQTQQLQVSAEYSDGSTRDVTYRALYESN